MKKILFLFIGLFSFNTASAQTSPPPFGSVNDGYGEYVFVPAGEFQMGDNFREGILDELPVHTVTLDAYYIGKYEVTNTQYAAFSNDRGAHSGVAGTIWYDIASGDARINLTGETYSVNNGFEDQPVWEVTWWGATEYAVWLSEKTGKTYRLPTEAEWEKAARGDAAANSVLGHQRKYPWGDTIDSSYANYDSSNPPDKNQTRTTPVGYYDGSTYGSFQTEDNSSPYGAYDMAGNLWEWTSDWYIPNYYANSPSDNPTGPTSGRHRVRRGGGWPLHPYFLRSAVRSWDSPSRSNVLIGFRCVRGVVVTGVEDDVIIPKDYVLHQNSPNPFNSSTTIQYTLARSGTVEINIYDVTGRFIRNLVSGVRASGSHSVVWDGKNASGSDVSSGIYFYQLRAADFNFVKRMQLIK